MNKNILLVEDVKSRQKQIRDLILDLGHNLINIISSATEAVDFIEGSDKELDLIILDIMGQGEINGFEVAEKISNCVDIPIIFLTSIEQSNISFSEDNINLAYVYSDKSAQQINKNVLKKNIELIFYRSKEKETKLELRKKSEELEKFFTINLDLLCIADTEGNFIKVNKEWERLLGYSIAELEGRGFLEFVHPDDLEATLATMESLGQQQEVLNFVNRFRDKSGSYHHIEWRSKSDDKLIYAAARDITDKKKKETKLKESKNLLENLANQVPGMMYQYQLFPDGTSCFPYASEGIYEIYAVTPEEVMDDASKAFDSIHPDDYQQVVESINQSAENLTVWQEEYRVELPEKGVVWVEGNARPEKLSDGSVLWHGNIRDITERKQQEQEIEYLSYRDSLTDLYNRRFFEEEIKRLDTERQLPISIIMSDVNGLKIINDSYGHQTGDQLLVKTAQILKEVVRDEDILARQGGDEFAILLPKTSNKQAQKIINRIKEKCKRTEKDKIPVSIGLGSATKNEAKNSLEETLKQADDAMYQNKLAKSKSTKSNVVQGLLNTLNAKSNETKEHSIRMTKLSYDLGEQLGLSYSELNRLSVLATLHDIGKTTIAEDILTKAGSLSEDEWEMIKKHPERGYKIATSSEEFAIVADEIFAHHEQWDGSGYPRGLKKCNIPYLARIISIIDAYDVMTNGRPYKEPFSQEEALAEIKRCAGSQFDPQLSEKFIRMIDSQDY
ncbi:MAG: diguanylate cyclase domain-containing protein [Bacillota bacterium]